MSGMKQTELPFLLRPAAKSYLWGGRRLNDDFAKGISADPLAETWECSTHPDGGSVIATGRCAGRKLSDALRENPLWLGTHPRALGLPEGQLPVLVKFIDAAEDLSVQVHPDDEYAKVHEGGQLGKTEFWYILDARKDSRLIFGLKEKETKVALRDAVQAGTLESHLKKVPVKKNDVFFVPPGTIHAIGAGVLAAEVQENSNVTYRLFDYERLDKTGKKRPLHIEKALDVAKLNGGESFRQPIRVLNYRGGFATELLGRCKYFQVERMILNTERVRDLVNYRTGPLSFEVFLCLDGCATVFSEDMYFPIFRGDCLFFPANSAETRLHGVCQFLVVKG